MRMEAVYSPAYRSVPYRNKILVLVAENYAK